jgi:hypothetical protein
MITTVTANMHFSCQECGAVFPHQVQNYVRVDPTQPSFGPHTWQSHLCLHCDSTVTVARVDELNYQVEQTIIGRKVA